MLTLAWRIASIIALTGFLAACGSGNTDASRAAQTVTAAFHALAAGDGAKVCSLATAAGQRSLAAAVPGSTCAKVVDLVSAHLNPHQKAALETVKVTHVAVMGNHATVRAADITSSRGSFKGFLDPKAAPTKLRRESDGTWKISA